MCKLGFIVDWYDETSGCLTTFGVRLLPIPNFNRISEMVYEHMESPFMVYANYSLFCNQYSWKSELPNKLLTFTRLAEYMLVFNYIFSPPVDRKLISLVLVWTALPKASKLIFLHTSLETMS
jgi:hypothetical protein